MNSLLQDLRYGFRMLLGKPGFTLVAVLTLALGIGANTAIFSVVNAVLLMPFPYPHAERLVTMRSNQSLPDLVDIQAQSKSFEEAGGVVLQALDFTGGAEPVQVQAGLSTAGLFNVLGAQPITGRTFTAEEDVYGGERTVVLSHGFWQRQFGGDPSVVGKQIPLSGNNYTVLGVLPADFDAPRESPEVYVSLRVVNPLAAKARGVHFLRTYWRMKPGVTLAQAQSEIEAIDRQLEQQNPAENKGRRTRLMSLHERVAGDTRPALLVLFGAVGLVLLIACANFANLLLARATSREREIVIRAALGAGRGRLIRQMLTESVMLSLMGGACGLMLALWGIDLLQTLKPANLPRLAAISIDGRVLFFTLGLSVLTGLVFGLVPALNASRLNVNDALKEGGRSATAGVARHRFSNVLVVTELALALLLLIGAGLLIKGFWRLRSVEPGFETNNLLTMRVELPEARYKEIPKQTQFRERALEAINTLPGVEAAMVSEVPLTNDALMHNFVIEGRAPLSPGEEPELFSRTVMSNYFRTMKIPLLKGRDFNPQDREGTPLVGIVNETFVRQYFPNSDVVGSRIRWARDDGEPKWITIVGVVGDVKHFGLNQDEQPAVYTPYAQLFQPWKRWMQVVVRSQGDSSTITNMVKAQIWKIDNQIPVTKVRTMTEVMAASLAAQRFNMMLLGIFAGVALLLATVGIYGLMSYSITERTHEIGIRMALGAQTSDVLRMVLGQGLKLITFGVALGLVGAFALTRIMSSLLFGVRAVDPLTFAVVSALLAIVALLACYIPARRATRTDPMIALRYE
ncbi:MAG TPA: ABC transporter permease [Pyrinomonadaceae bacterium]|jgi:putative ABC transport system permease protein|nr:ABC transporter permease [Pyrinomonadaceae bacterium]